MITVLRPDAVVAEPAEAFTTAPRCPLRGGRLAIIDNGKPRGRELLSAIAEGLVNAHGLGSVQVVVKPGASHRISAQEGAELASVADMFLTGLGDCAGCSAYSLMDAVVMETLGRPATVVVSEPFAARVSVYAQRLGANGFPTVVVPHPVASRSVSELAAIADRAMRTVALILEGQQ